MPEWFCSINDRFRYPWLTSLGARTSGPILETLAEVAHMRNHIPEPFDVFAHAGNLWGGAVIATVAVDIRNATALRKKTFKQGNEQPGSYLTQAELRSFRRKWVPAVVGATLAVNAVTETKWGVQALPVAKWLNGTTPDPLDAAYSAAFGGVIAGFGWRRQKPAITPLANTAPLKQGRKGKPTS